MITQIRKNVFETNSSSSHVLVIDTEDKEKPVFSLTKNIKMTIPEVDYEGNYGNGDILDDFESKLKYLICYAGANIKWVRALVEIAKKICKEQGVNITFPKEVEKGTYIWDEWCEDGFVVNHQSNDNFDWLFEYLDAAEKCGDKQPEYKNMMKNSFYENIKTILTDNRIQFWLCWDSEERVYDIYDPFYQFKEVNGRSIQYLIPKSE